MSVAAIIEAGCSSQDTQRGRVFDIPYRVTGVTGATQAEQIDDAYAATGLPALGAAFPGHTDIVVTSRRVQVGAAPVPSSYVVLVHYERPTALDDHPRLDTTGVLRMNSSTVAECTTEDKDGSAMVTVWTGTQQDIYPNVGAIGTWIENRRVEVDVLRARLSFSLTKRYTGAARFTTIRTLQDTYVSSVNSTVWSGFAARTVQCVGMPVEETTAEEARVEWRFEVRPDTFDFEHTIRVAGIVPRNAVAGNGIETYRLHDEADFTLSGVSVP